MKPIHYIICATAVLLSACQNELPDNPTATHGELTFNASVDGVSVAQSRAAAVDTDLTTNGFFLAGYHTTGKIDAVQATAYPNVFDKEVADQQIAVPLVKYENGKFALKTIKWLLDDVSYLSFFGWSQSKPYATAVDASTTGIIGQTFDSNDKGYPWIDIRNANAPLDQTDIVGSRSIDHPNDAVISAVDLNFHHLLSKLTFKAKSTSKANIAFTGVNIKYAASKVRKKARYTFGSDASTIGSYSLDATEFQAGTAPLGSSYPAIAAGAEVVLGSVLLVPQALQAGDVSIELKYKLSPNGGGIAGAEQTKTLPLSAFTFEQGNNYAYSIDIQATDILVMGNPGVEAWNVEPYTALPTIAGPRGDTQLWLDGYDKPYTHSDGKKYWLDRSGYNRHVELTAGYQSYDATKHGYVFSKSAGSGGVIPDMGTVSYLNVDLIAEGITGNTDRQTPFKLGQAYLEIPYLNNTIDWNYPGGDAARWSAPSSANIAERTFWTTTLGGGYARIYYDATLRTEKAVSVTTSLTGNSLATGYNGTILYLRITSNNRSANDVESQLKACSKRYGVSYQYLTHPPTSSQILEVNNLLWTKANLVAVNNAECRVGVPGDGGVYFQYGGLIGYKGGANGDGIGIVNATTHADNKYWGGATTYSANDVAVTPMDYKKQADWPFFKQTSGGFGYYYYTDFTTQYKDFQAQGNSKNPAIGIGDPCDYYLGSPWRLPTYKELATITGSATGGSWVPWSTSTVAGKWSDAGPKSAKGAWFGPNSKAGTPTENTDLFIPVSGYRWPDHGGFKYAGREALLWSSSINDAEIGFSVVIGVDGVIPYALTNRAYAFPIRCVKSK